MPLSSVSKSDPAAVAALAVATAISQKPPALDALPIGEPMRLHKGGDGALTVTRESDNAVWDGERFVVPEPPPNVYAVAVHVEAIDSPTACGLVEAAMAAAVKAAIVTTYDVQPLADFVREGGGA